MTNKDQVFLKGEETQELSTPLVGLYIVTSTLEDSLAAEKLSSLCYSFADTL